MKYIVRETITRNENLCPEIYEESYETMLDAVAAWYRWIDGAIGAWGDERDGATLTWGVYSLTITQVSHDGTRIEIIAKPDEIKETNKEPIFVSDDDFEEIADWVDAVFANKILDPRLVEMAILERYDTRELAESICDFVNDKRAEM